MIGIRYTLKEVWSAAQSLIKLSTLRTTSVSLCVYNIRTGVGWPLPIAALQRHVIVEYGL